MSYLLLLTNDSYPAIETRGKSNCQETYYCVNHIITPCFSYILGPLPLTCFHFNPTMVITSVPLNVGWNYLLIYKLQPLHYVHDKVYDDITYPFPNFNGCTVEVWEWIINFIQHLSCHVISYPCCDYHQLLWVKGTLLTKLLPFWLLGEINSKENTQTNKKGRHKQVGIKWLWLV